MRFASIKTYLSFIGRRATVFGCAGVLVGFLSFCFDLALATMLQRFFMATGLLTVGSSMPLGVDLKSPVVEGIGLIVVGLLRAMTIWANGYLTGLCQVSVEVEKRHSLTEWSISHGGQEIGTTMSYFNDIIIGAAASIGNLFYILSRLVMLSGIFIAMAVYSMPISLFVIAFVMVIAPLQMVIDRIISRHSKIIQSSLAQAVSFLSRAIKNNLFLSLHNLTKHEISHIQESVSDYGQSSIRYYSLSSLRAVMPQVLGLVAVVTIAIQGHSYFAENPAVLMAFLYMVLRFFQTLSDVARVSGNLRLNYPRISLLYEWWKQNINSYSAPQPALLSANSNRPIGWRAQSIGFIWPNGKATAIHNLDFEIKAGTTTLIVGQSGAGKTTLFHILLGLIQPTSGKLFVLDENDEPQEITGRIPQIISYVGPDPFLVAGTVRDQLLIGNEAVSDDVLSSALRSVHADFVFEFSDGLDHTLTEQGHGLSAGQKQRLALARAILRKPSVLLLDEATANLDEQTEKMIIELINELRGQMTILAISHRPHPELRVDTSINLNLVERIAA